MADLDLPALGEWQRGELARHLEVTRHLCYGGRERQDALLFRVPFDHPDVADTTPPAVFLTQLAAAVRSGGARVKAPGMGKADAVRVSELLAQSAGRSSREGRDETVTRALTRLRTDWDASRRVPAGEYERAEHLGVEASRREAEQARQENARLRRALTGA